MGDYCPTGGARERGVAERQFAPFFQDDAGVSKCSHITVVYFQFAAYYHNSCL